jgi:hypothetical protein
MGMDTSIMYMVSVPITPNTEILYFCRNLPAREKVRLVRKPLQGNLESKNKSQKLVSLSAGDPIQPCMPENSLFPIYVTTVKLPECVPNRLNKDTSLTTR